MSFSRRRFIQAFSALFVGAGRVLADAVRRVILNKAEAKAAAQGQALGLGSARLEGPQSVEVSSHGTWTLVYDAGRAGIERGGGIRIALRHLQRQVAVPQATDPKQANYVTATADGGVPVKIDIPHGWKAFMTQYFAWQNIVQVTLPEAGLSPGGSLRITFGDRSGGGPGMRVQPYDESHYGFKCYVDAKGDGNYLPLPKTPTIEVVAARWRRLRVVMPSNAVVGEPTWCIVRAEDRYGNPAPRFRGTVELVTGPAWGIKEFRTRYTFREEDRGVHRFEGVRFDSPNMFCATCYESRLGIGWESNPVLVRRERPEKLLLWGDLHGHTLFSDGRGTVEEYYDFAQRVAGLDFCAVSDHAFELVDEMWAHSKAVTNRLNQPGTFVTFNGYEWSGQTPDGGDHNCYFLADEPPIFRSTLMYDRRNLQMDHAAEKVKTVAELMERLARLLRDKDVLCIPHFGGRRGNPRWHDPRVQRLIEVYSDHQRSEAWANTFLAAGHRVGIMASTDNHYGNPGYGYLKIQPDWRKQEIGTSLVAVYAAERTREAIFHALYDRRTYATSGARIILDVRANGQPMGSELRAAEAPLLEVLVIGTANIDRIEIKKNGKVAHVEPGQRDAMRFEWRDPAFQPDQSCYYVVRVVQKDNEEAIASPIWVD